MKQVNWEASVGRIKIHLLLLFAGLIGLQLPSPSNSQVLGFSINDLLVNNNNNNQNVDPSNDVDLSRDAEANLRQILLTAPTLFGASVESSRQDENEPDVYSQDKRGPLLGSPSEIYLLEDKDYPKSLFERYLGVGQVSGITTLPSDDVAIFHRADREWTDKSFNANNTVANFSSAQDNLIKNDTIMIIDRDDGSAVTTFGANLFYIPHSITSDNRGNLWVTDVGRHQVMRLPTSMMQLEQHKRALGLNSKAAKKVASLPAKHRWLPGNMTRIWPDIILGEAFVPGSDFGHFCKPSEVAVSADGRLVYVADGYCNKRVMVFTGTGKFVTSFGEAQAMEVVHSLTLIEERNLICVADREHSRIHCFKAGLDGDLASLGELVLSVNYPIGRVFAIEAISAHHLLVASNQAGTNRFDLATLNPFEGELKQTWSSSDLLAPHALARTKDGQFVYVADLSKGAYKKVFKFEIIQRKLQSQL